MFTLKHNLISTTPYFQARTKTTPQFHHISTHIAIMVSVRVVLFSLAPLIPSITAVPAPQHLTGSTCSTGQQPFYLVTTTSPCCLGNSSELANVSATSLFDSFHAPTYMLRLIGPGYLSLPLFSLSDGTLQTQSPDTFGQGNYTYSSQPITSNADLEFVQSTSGGDGLSFVGNGNLLAVNGSAVGWTICTGDLEQGVVGWEGSDARCEATYVQAAAKPPY